MTIREYFRHLFIGFLLVAPPVTFAQLERIDSMTEQGEIMRFCAGFKNRTDNQACLTTGQKRLDDLYKQKTSEREARKRGGPGEECIRSVSDYCKTQKEVERGAREAQIAAAAQERRKLEEEQQKNYRRNAWRSRNEGPLWRHAKNRVRQDFTSLRTQFS